jgi:ATP/ADP translocase
MMFCIIYVFTMTRDTKDTLIVSYCGAFCPSFLPSLLTHLHTQLID